MDLSQYKQMLRLFPEKPDLNKLVHGDSIPEAWPLVVRLVENDLDSQLVFDLTDSKTTLSCQVKDVKMIEKVVSMKSGQIVFIYDSKIYKNKESGEFLIDLGYVYTLKEVNDGLAKQVNKNTSANKSPRKIVIRKNVAPEARKTSATRQEQDSKWRTLSERWQKQGKL